MKAMAITERFGAGHDIIAKVRHENEGLRTLIPAIEGTSISSGSGHKKMIDDLIEEFHRNGT